MVFKDALERGFSASICLGTSRGLKNKILLIRAKINFTLHNMVFNGKLRKRTYLAVVNNDYDLKVSTNQMILIIKR